MWRNVNDYLNTSKRSFSNTPNLILHNNEVFTKPRDIANAINDAFIKKVKDLRGKVAENAEIDPKERLQHFLDKRTEEIPQFELKKINARQLRNLLKKRKGNRSCGIKKGDKTLGENWRPVTDIVFVSKLAEAAV